MSAERDPGTVEYEIGPDGTLTTVRRRPLPGPTVGELMAREQQEREARRLAAKHAFTRELDHYFGRYKGVVRIPLSQLKLFDAAYQRPVNLTRVRFMRDGFEREKFGALLVMRRPTDEVPVIDGRHRCETLGGLIDDPDLGIPAVELPWDGPQSEAKAFYGFNRDRFRLTSVRGWIAALAFGDEKTLEIQALLERRGERVEATRRQGGIQAVDSLITIYDTKERGGSEALNAVLTIARGAFGTGTDAVTGTVLRGIFYFWRAYHREPLYRQADLIAALKRVTPLEVVKEGRNTAGTLGAHGPTTFAAGVVEVFNTGRRGRKLPIWKERPHQQVDQDRGA